MKAVLVIDMPTDCKNCMFCGFGGIYNELNVCMITGSNGTEEKLDRCPLIPLPQKKVGDDLYERYGSWTLSDEKEASYRVGFNDCLDEIIGETE